jgi:hypothetical protein
MKRYPSCGLLACIFGATAACAADGDPQTAPPTPTPAPAPAPVIVMRNAVSPGSLDLRLGIGGQPGIAKVKDKNGGATTEIEKDGGGDIDVEVLYVRARPESFGFAAGGGLFSHSHMGKDDGLKPQINASGLEGQAALVYRFTPHFHIEAPALVVGLGSAKATKIGVNDSDNGGYGSIAVQVGAYYSFRFGLQLGAAIGVESWSSTVKQDDGTGTKQDFTYSGGGGYLTLQGGFRF